MIEAHDLTVTYDGRDVLHKVTLTVPDGAHIALMGPSGCGKTTLLRVPAGLRAPDGGSVRVSPGRIACVFQEPRLLPWRWAWRPAAAALQAALRAPMPRLRTGKARPLRKPKRVRARPLRSRAPAIPPVQAASPPRPAHRRRVSMSLPRASSPGS